MFSARTAGILPVFLIGPILFLGSLTPLQAAAKLRLSSATLGPVSIDPGSSANAQIVEAYNVGDSDLSLRTTSSVSWLQPTIGTPRGCLTRVGTCLPINISFNASSLTRGSYTGIVTVADPNALDAPQNIAVMVQIGGGVPDQVNLYVTPNGSSDDFKFSANQLLNGSSSTQTGGPWLQLALDGSGSFRFVYPYHIAGRFLDGMAEGVYTGSVAVTGSNISSENKTVAVRLQVTSQPIARLSPSSASFRVAPGAPVQQSAITVSNRGMGTLSVSSVSATTASGGGWLSVTNSANTITINADGTNVAVGSYSGTVTVNTNAANSSLTVPVNLDVVAASNALIVFGGVVNSGNYDDGLAPGTVAAIFGEQLSFQPAAQATSVPLGQDMGGLRVLVNDQPAPLYFTSYNQVNFQIPFETPPGDAVIRIDRDGQRGNSVSAQIQPRAPRILQVGDAGLIVNSDGSLAQPGGRPARPGEAITIYCVGFGATSPGVGTGAAAPGVLPLAQISPAPRVVIGNFFNSSVITPVYIGLTPSLVGLYQINVILPDDVPQGDIALFIDGDSYRSNTVVVPIHQQ